VIRVPVAAAAGLLKAAPSTANAANAESKIPMVFRVEVRVAP
jgi:hypothetical protein